LKPVENKKAAPKKPGSLTRSALVHGVEPPTM
jgi:hypothetical protein